MNSTPPDWRSIVQAHGSMAFYTAWRMLGNSADTEDVVQDALLDAFRLHARQPVNNWGGVLRQLVTRRAIDYLRKRRPVVAAPAEAYEPAGPPCEQPEAAAIQKELAERLRGAIGALTDREASVFSLHYFGEMPNSQIAETLGISTDAAAVALHKARKRLKELLGLQEAEARRSKS